MANRTLKPLKQVARLALKVVSNSHGEIDLQERATRLTNASRVQAKALRPANDPPLAGSREVGTGQELRFGPLLQLASCCLGRLVGLFEKHSITRRGLRALRLPPIACSTGEAGDEHAVIPIAELQDTEGVQLGARQLFVEELHQCLQLWRDLVGSDYEPDAAGTNILSDLCPKLVRVATLGEEPREVAATWLGGLELSTDTLGVTVAKASGVVEHLADNVPS